MHYIDSSHVANLRLVAITVDKSPILIPVQDKLLDDMIDIFFVVFRDLYVCFDEKDDAHYTALLLVSLLLFINIYSLISFFELYFYPQIKYEYYWLFIIQLLILILNFFLFIYRKKYIGIIKNYRIKRTKFKYFDILFTISYVVTSIVIWVYLGSELRELYQEE